MTQAGSVRTQPNPAVSFRVQAPIQITGVQIAPSCAYPTDHGVLCLVSITVKTTGSTKGGTAIIDDAWLAS